MARHNETGKWGEDIAADYLTEQGFAIAERNWRMNHLEIDIVATRGDDIVFVEVKTRADRQTDPLEAMTPRKVALLCRAAEVYLRVNHVRLTPRFDVAAVSGDGHTCEMEYIPNAFLPPLKSY